MAVNTEQLNELLKELRANEPEKRKKVSGFAKKLTTAIIIITFVVGIVGSFEAVPINMKDFTSFIPMFASLFIPLVLSIGVNSAIEKHEKAELEKEKIKQGKNE